MSTSSFWSRIRDLLASHSRSPFEAVALVSLLIPADDCAEVIGDKAREWCADNCAGQWRQVARGASADFEFEDLEDAVLFRVRH